MAFMTSKNDRVSHDKPHKCLARNFCVEILTADNLHAVITKGKKNTTGLLLVLGDQKKEAK